MSLNRAAKALSSNDAQGRLERRTGDTPHQKDAEGARGRRVRVIYTHFSSVYEVSSSDVFVSSNNNDVDTNGSFPGHST